MASSAGNIFDQLFARLAKEERVQVEISEMLNSEWLADRQLLPNALKALESLPSWSPRPGELVLFFRRLDAGQEIAFDEHSQQFKIFDSSTGQVSGQPEWQAGVITQTAEEQVSLDDLIREPASKVFDRNYSGFRIELMGNPSDYDGSFSKRYSYVPLHRIRPFSFWQEFLTGLPEDEMHETIGNALLASRTVSLVDRFGFDGTWPDAIIYCKGIYIGTELILRGDLVRVKNPQVANNTKVIHDVLQVKAIRIRLINLDDDFEGFIAPYTTAAIELLGSVWTQDEERNWNNSPANTSFSADYPFPADLTRYDRPFYPTSPPGSMMLIAFNHVIGRCMGTEAQQLWLPPSPSSGIEAMPSLSDGLAGVMAAHQFAAINDRRLEKVHSKWVWADHRAEALGLKTVNGFDIMTTVDEDVRDGAEEPSLDAASQQQQLQGAALIGVRAGNSTLIRTGLEATTVMDRDDGEDDEEEDEEDDDEEGEDEGDDEEDDDDDSIIGGGQQQRQHEQEGNDDDEDEVEQEEDDDEGGDDDSEDEDEAERSTSRKRVRSDRDGSSSIRPADYNGAHAHGGRAGGNEGGRGGVASLTTATAAARLGFESSDSDGEDDALGLVDDFARPSGTR